MLLQLPQAVFAKIVTEVVCSEDIFPALRLREVCTSFEREATAAFVSHRLADLNDLPPKCTNRLPPSFKFRLLKEAVTTQQRDRNDFANYVWAVADDLASFANMRVKEAWYLIHAKELIDDVCQAIVYAKKECACNQLLFSPSHVCKLGVRRGPNLQQMLRKTNLGVAVVQNRVDIVRAMLHSGLSPDGECPVFRNSLKLSCELGHVEIVKVLLEAGAGQRKNLQRVEAALKVAAEGGHVGILQLLLSPRYNLMVSRQAIDNAVASAAVKGHFDAVRCITKICPGVHPVTASIICTSAAKRGRADIVRGLLKGGLNPRAGWSSVTLLEVAAEKGHLDICQYLLRHGYVGDLEERSDVLTMCVAIGGSVPTFRLLRKHGMEFVHPAEMIVIAAEWGHTAMLQFALSNEFDKHHRETDQLMYHALLSAIAHNREETTRILHQRTKTVRSRMLSKHHTKKDSLMSYESDSKENTERNDFESTEGLLLIAIDSGNVEMVELLVNLGEVTAGVDFTGIEISAETRMERERAFQDFRDRLGLDRRYAWRSYQAPQWKVDEAMYVVRESSSGGWV